VITEILGITEAFSSYMSPLHKNITELIDNQPIIEKRCNKVEKASNKGIDNILRLSINIMKSSNFLRNKGIALTLPRSLIIKAIESYKNRHFSAEDILRLAAKRSPAVSRATVFRTLKLFLDKGILRTVDIGEGFKLYELAVDSHHHDHLYCLKCSKIIEFYHPKIERFQKDVCKSKKFYPLRHTLRISGLCDKCKGKEGA
jgi:Fur family transcriptional regulator, ferric uptake regulator